MKVRLTIAIMLGLILTLGVAGIAGAQSLCDTIVSDPGGAPGGEATICGTAFQGDDVTVYFDGEQVGSAVGDEYNEFCITFTIPADATDGVHELGIFIEGEGTAECFTGFVVAGVTETPAPAAPAVVAPATVLPSTGFMLLPAGAGLAAAGLGAMMIRRKRRS